MPSEYTMRRGRPAALRAGFTLLEVLAAFLIFAVLFTVLAGTASEAFRSEGANRRRLEASLLADEKLAELEQTAQEIGEESQEEDIFLITTSVSPLTADRLGLDLDPDRGPGERSSRDDDDELPETSILSPDDAQDEAPLRRIDLLVEWEEGTRTLAVRRSTIALDTSGLSFPGAGEGGAGENPLGGDGDGAGGAEALEDCGDDPIQCMIDALGGLE
jgi:prepilin-type N-terminal cleavage/methylation domain-containing protein